MLELQKQTKGTIKPKKKILVHLEYELIEESNPTVEGY